MDITDTLAASGNSPDGGIVCKITILNLLAAHQIDWRKETTILIAHHRHSVAHNGRLVDCYLNYISPHGSA